MKVNITANILNYFSNGKYCNIEEVYTDWEKFQKSCNTFNSKHINKYIKLYDLFRDFRTYKVISKDPTFYLSLLDRGYGYEEISKRYNLDCEYFFYYMFPLRNPLFNLVDLDNQENLSFTNEEEKKLIKYYDRFDQKINNVLDFFHIHNIPFEKAELSYNIDVVVNNKHFKHFIFVPTCMYLNSIIDPDTLYIFLNSCMEDNDMFEKVNSQCISLPFKILTSDEEFIKSITANFFSSLQRHTTPISIIVSTSKNDSIAKSIAKLRAEEKSLSVKVKKGQLLFTHPIVLSYNTKKNIDLNAVSKDDLDRIICLKDVNLAISLGMDPEHARLNHLYYKNGKIKNYYITEETDMDIFEQLKHVTNIFVLDPMSSIFENELAKSFKDKGAYFLRDEEIKTLYANSEINTHQYIIMTPDFYFPDGIFINGVLCYWIELKRSLSPESKQQIIRYNEYLGQGAVFMEEGYDKLPRIPRVLFANVTRPIHFN